MDGIEVLEEAKAQRKRAVELLEAYSSGINTTRRLTKKQTEVWVLYIQGKSLSDIGLRLGISKDAVWQRIRLAKKKL